MSICKDAPVKRLKQEQLYVCLATHCQVSIRKAAPVNR